MLPMKVTPLMFKEPARRRAAGLADGKPLEIGLAEVSSSMSKLEAESPVKMEL